MDSGGFVRDDHEWYLCEFFSFKKGGNPLLAEAIAL